MAIFVVNDPSRGQKRTCSFDGALKMVLMVIYRCPSNGSGLVSEIFYCCENLINAKKPDLGHCVSHVFLRKWDKQLQMGAIQGNLNGF